MCRFLSSGEHILANNHKILINVILIYMISHDMRKFLWKIFKIVIFVNVCQIGHYIVIINTISALNGSIWIILSINL